MAHPSSEPGSHSSVTVPGSSPSEPELDTNQYIIVPSETQTEPQELHSDEEDSDETGSGSDSDETGSGSDPNETGSGSESDSNKSAPEPIAMVPVPGSSVPVAGKKRVANRKASAAKRYKKNPDFNRIFREEDEYTLLKGMLRWAETTKSGPLDDLDAFLRFVKGDLKANPTAGQLKSKIDKFKQKYTRNRRKQAQAGARNLSAHERRAYELSKLAWDNVYIKNQKVPRGWKEAEAEEMDVAASGGAGPRTEAAAEETGREIVSMDDVSADWSDDSRNGAQDFKSEWRELLKAELEVHLKILELKCETTRLVLGVLNR
ncbi:hypothetical protein CASFOL_031635 [Castilleja foliolosa]|uniref:Glabrous enhancer-binding protein-like DBD domain-containing protein n=1 Tax=Castilleja foliolosa TaxID=1961234 RepID=A0ABD3C5X6_9LAMI